MPFPKRVSADARPARMTLLPAVDTSPQAAREFTRETLASWLLASALDNVELVASELVTNAVLHGEGDVTLTLSIDGGGVRVEVRDDAVAEPSEGVLSGSRTGGRRLVVVAALSTQWGSSSEPAGGKVVWAQVNVGPVLTPARPIANTSTLRRRGVFTTQVRAMLTLTSRHQEEG
jgi:hypothetical protein